MKKLDFSSLKSPEKDPAAEMPAFSSKKILLGFWHNWPALSANGYQGGKSQDIALTDIPKAYNVIAVAFMKGSGIPTFTPCNYTDEEFRHQIGTLKSEGRTVLLSLGGADAQIAMASHQVEPLAYEIIRLVETYGFNGVDIDLEQSAINAAANQTVIPQALKRVKDYYKEQNKYFVISMAPEFPHLTLEGKYVPYLDALDGYYDFIAPQYYNQGGDGVWVDEINTWLAQNNDARKEDFLYYLTDSLISGTRNYSCIPHNKFVIGLPCNPDAAATGYVINPAEVKNVFSRLKEAGNPIRGVMTWSVNWDAGENQAGIPYNWEFCQRYAELIARESDSNEEKPTAPFNLRSSQQTQTSVLLTWEHADSSKAISSYTLYRNGGMVGQTDSFSFHEISLAHNSHYNYYVTATDSTGQESLPSNILYIQTLDYCPDTEYPQWQAGRDYARNSQVTYQGRRYRCINPHHSQSDWTPDVVASLWMPHIRQEICCY